MTKVRQVENLPDFLCSFEHNFDYCSGNCAEGNNHGTDEI
jgi:hypothetical protein